LGTNPVSVALPANKERPIVLDMATSVVAAGKIRAKYAKGEKTPEGWIIDNNGQPTVDPSTFLSLRGMLLPAGGYKGYGLSLVIDALCGALTGSGCCSTEFQWGNGVMMQAINIGAFTPVEAFKERIDSLTKSIKSTLTAPGSEEVLIPGEPEFRIAEDRARNGIPVDDTTWQALTQLGKEAGLSL
jgi:LDH2 family malate/lactate/ureidoglycolate dehydrogenase